MKLNEIELLLDYWGVVNLVTDQKLMKVPFLIGPSKTYTPRYHWHVALFVCVCVLVSYCDHLLFDCLLSPVSLFCSCLNSCATLSTIKCEHNHHLLGISHNQNVASQGLGAKLLHPSEPVFPVQTVSMQHVLPLPGSMETWL
jgi:hypothetical protein